MTGNEPDPDTGNNTNGDNTSVGASDHHAKYTDAEAISAVEGEATLAFQQAITISTTAGVLTLSPTGDLVVAPT